MKVDLADLYQAAQIPLPADDFRLRQTALGMLTGTLTHPQIMECCRIYFGWVTDANGPEWFVNAFRNDPRFSMVSNKREASVLAGNLLLEQLLAGDAFAGLAVLCASLQGRRLPLVQIAEPLAFQTALNNLAIEKQTGREYNIDFSAIAPVEFASGTDEEEEGTAVAEAFEAQHASLEKASSEIHRVVRTMAVDLAAAREQLAIMWWLLGAWSRQLDRSFVNLGSPLAYVAAGFDLADLSRSPQGPYAAGAVLARVTADVKKSRKPITIAEIGDAVSPDDAAKLRFGQGATAYPDICPLSHAILKCTEIGKGVAWHASFENAARTTVAITLSTQEIAQQLFYERLLLTNL